MAGYDQKIKVKADFENNARAFFKFLQAVGKKYARPIKIKYRYMGRGYFFVTIDGGTGGIDAIFQELVLNRGLYYYACTLDRKREIINYVILPIFTQLIEQRFDNSKSRFIRKHILGKHAQTDFIPSHINNKHGYSFEILFRKWDLELISSKDYVIELDSLLNQFVLEKLSHQQGAYSDEMPKLVNKLKISFMFNEDAEMAFLEIHKMRTQIIHRLGQPKSKEELSGISNILFNYFSYIDDFEYSQKIKYVRKGNKKYKRFKYGEAVWNIDGEIFEESSKANEPCGDCAATLGFFHSTGCDLEQCPACKEQLLSCNHNFIYN